MQINYEIINNDLALEYCKISSHFWESLVNLNNNFNYKNKEQHGSTLSFKRNNKCTYS